MWAAYGTGVVALPDWEEEERRSPGSLMAGPDDFLENGQKVKRKAERKGKEKRKEKEGGELRGWRDADAVRRTASPHLPGGSKSLRGGVDSNATLFTAITI